MKIIFDYIILFLFIISCLLLGGTIIGPVSIRIYIALLTLIYLILYGYKYPLKKEVFLYILFILSYFLALFFNGEIIEVDFVKYFFGRFFICLIAVYAIWSLVRSKKTLDHVIYLFVVIGIVNGTISLLQFWGNSLGFLVPMLLNPVQEAQEKLVLHLSIFSVIDVGVVGVYGNIVKNGYFSSSIAIMSFFLYNVAKKQWQKWITFIISNFLLLTVFMTQQRAAFIFVFIFYLFFLLKKPRLLAITGWIIIIFAFYAGMKGVDITSFDLGRIDDLSDVGRQEIYLLAVEFIKDNFLFGGQNAFANLLYANGFGLVQASHNVFFNAFIYSGILGGLIIIYLYFMLFKKAWKAMLKKINIISLNRSLILGGSLIILLLNSLVHNSSLVTGDEFIWILYILLLKSLKFEREDTLNVTTTTGLDLPWEPRHIYVHRQEDFMVL